MEYINSSDAIEVRVHPRFSLSRSSIEDRRYVFTYDVRIENHRPEAVRLLYRRWLIHDSDGDDREIEGEGVVGRQPLIPPGGAHDYRSYCILESPLGGMEGHYDFETEEGRALRVGIPRFPLVGPFLPPNAGGAMPGDLVDPSEDEEEAGPGWN